MDLQEEKLMTGGKSESFFSYLTTITSVEKNELLNVFQYILLVIIPLVFFLKFMKEYIPPENTSKSTIEIATEVLIQVFLIFVVFWLIHKIVLYIPTYSKSPYEKINMVQMVLPVLFLLLCMKSTLSEKMSILLDRILILIGIRKEGMDDDDDDDDHKRKTKSNTNKKKICKQSMEPPMMSMPMMPMPQLPQKPINTSLESREMPEINTNYGIGVGMGEPMASNEMGCSFLNY
jgi:hypothetical protein